MEQSKLLVAGRPRVVWLDVVRLVAMFTVVCCHCTDPFNFYPGDPPANIAEIKFWGAAYGAFLRPCEKILCGFCSASPPAAGKWANGKPPEKNGAEGSLRPRCDGRS